MDIGSVSNIWMDGRPSGLPEDIEDQLAEVKRQQLVTPIQNKIDTVTTTRKALAGLDKQVVSLLETVNSLNSEDAFNARSACSSSQDVVTVSAESGASQGTYSLEVTAKATAHTEIVGISDGTPGNKLVNGLTDHEDPDLIADGVQVSFDHQGSSFSYNTDEDSTLSSLAEAIDSDENGVLASVTNVGTTESPEYVLLLKSQTTGAGEQAISNLSADGLFEGQTTETEETQSGQNAEFTMDGVQYTRASNSLDDIISGVSISIQEQGETEVTVTQDTQSTVSLVENFVSAFNATKESIDTKTAYNQEEETSGPLIGSSIVNRLDSNLSQMILEPITGTSDNAYQYLSQVGVQFTQDGTLELDSQVLNTAMEENPEDVQALFTGDNGIAKRMTEDIGAYTNDTDGMITYKLESLDHRLEGLQEDLNEAEEDSQEYLERMVHKYTAMEQAIMRYQSMEEEVNAMISSLESNEGSS